MLLTNINIVNDTNRFTYVVEYCNRDLKTVELDFHYHRGLTLQKDGNEIKFDDIIFCPNNEQNTYIKHINDWYCVDESELIVPDYYEESLDVIKKNGYLQSSIKLYFPDYSVDTYLKNTKYALTISTWILGKHIILGSYIVDRTKALACPGVKKFYNEVFHEYIEMPIIDPLTFIYSDDWKLWRQIVCGENQQNNLINTVGSVLYCTLYPVVASGEHYIKADQTIGGQNSIQLTEDRDDFLNLSINSNIHRSLRGESPSIECKIGFNKFYSGSLSEYIQETYGIQNSLIKYELVIYDKDNIYTVCESKTEELTENYKPEYKFTKADITKNNFDDGNGWVPGMEVKCSVSILNENKTILQLFSNILPFTPELFSYLVKTEFVDKYGYTINNVNLDDVDMNILNINVVNKTENQIVKIDRPIENRFSGPHISFYRTTELYSIFVQPAVTENICLNLDSYKHLVKYFILQIEGVKFVEIGRVKSGVLFKVIGNKLPKKTTSGQYYVLDQNADLITSGKYTYKI